MKRVGRATLMLGTLLAVGCGPVLLMPGGRLAGEVRPAPADWTFSEAIDTVQLETRPGAPYSVTVWGAFAEGSFFVIAGDRERRWVQHIARDPRVRLKVCEDVYELEAVEVTDPSEVERLFAVFEQKYDYAPSQAARAEAVAFRLLPR